MEIKFILFFYNDINLLLFNYFLIKYIWFEREFEGVEGMVGNMKFLNRWQTRNVDVVGFKSVENEVIRDKCLDF